MGRNRDSPYEPTKITKTGVEIDKPKVEWTFDRPGHKSAISLGTKVDPIPSLVQSILNQFIGLDFQNPSTSYISLKIQNPLFGT